MYLYVGGSNPATSFTVNTLTGQRNRRATRSRAAMVHNAGGRAADFSGILRLSEVTGGLTGGPYQAQLGATLAPGQSEPVLFLLTGQVGNGPWNATVTLRSGLNQESFRGRSPSPRGPGRRRPAAPAKRCAHSGLRAASGLAALLSLASRRYRTRTLTADGSVPISEGIGTGLTGGRYWDRTSDLLGVNEALSR